MTMLGRGRRADETIRDDKASNETNEANGVSEADEASKAADEAADDRAGDKVDDEAGGEAGGEADKAGAADEADEKARKAEEAVRRAQELAEQARKAAEEARVALEEAERERARAAERAGPGSEASGGENGLVTVRPKYALTKEDDRDAEAGESADSAETLEPAESGEPSPGGAGAGREAKERAGADDAAAEADDAAADESADRREAADDLVSDAAEKGGTSTAEADGKDGPESRDEEDGESAGEGAESPYGPAGAIAKRRRKVVLKGGLDVYGVVLLTLAVLLAVATGWLWVLDNRLSDAEEARRQVAFAAAQAAQDLSSYDYRTVDSDLRRAAAHTTGKFRDEFAKTTSQVKQNAAKQQVVTEGIALKTGIEKVDGDRAVAIVFLNQETTKASNPQRLPSQFRLRLTMKRVKDRWLVEKLEVL